MATFSETAPIQVSGGDVKSESNAGGSTSDPSWFTTGSTEYAIITISLITGSPSFSITIGGNGMNISIIGNSFYVPPGATVGWSCPPSSSFNAGYVKFKNQFT